MNLAVSSRSSLSDYLYLFGLDWEGSDRFSFLVSVVESFSGLAVFFSACVPLWDWKSSTEVVCLESFLQERDGRFWERISRLHDSIRSAHRTPFLSEGLFCSSSDSCHFRNDYSVAMCPISWLRAFDFRRVFGGGKKTLARSLLLVL